MKILKLFLIYLSFAAVFTQNSLGSTPFLMKGELKILWPNLWSLSRYVPFSPRDLEQHEVHFTESGLLSQRTFPYFFGVDVRKHSVTPRYEFHLFIVDKFNKLIMHPASDFSHENPFDGTTPPITHFSLSQKEEVRLAGQMILYNGKVVVLSGFSDEYSGNTAALLEFYGQLKGVGAIDPKIWATNKDLRPILGNRIKFYPYESLSDYIQLRASEEIKPSIFCKNLVYY